MMFIAFALVVSFSVGVVILVFRKGKRRFGLFWALGSFALFMVVAMVNASNEAREKGFESYSDLMDAQRAGVSDAKQWSDRKAAKLAAAQEQKKAEEAKAAAAAEAVKAEADRKAAEVAAQAQAAKDEADRKAAEVAAQAQAAKDEADRKAAEVAAQAQAAKDEADRKAAEVAAQAQAAKDEADRKAAEAVATARAIKEAKEAKDRRFGLHCLSEWDGSLSEFRDTIQNMMREPSSFEHIETRVMSVDAKGNNKVLMKYRSRNGFGGMNVAVAIGEFSNSTCKVVSIESVE
ncbi:hypothetical protein [Paenirhodobacter enshiensis]|uniref:hypothetical protein n=1 Tax=Paenirhodobacter enshiensis TaxID=1105367 RepID=UPI0035AE9670